MQSAVGAGHELRRHVLDPLLASLALFDSAEDLEARVHTLFNVRGGWGWQARGGQRSKWRLRDIQRGAASKMKELRNSYLCSSKRNA